MTIRAKWFTINGKTYGPYWYEVKSIRRGKKVIQKHIRYIGKEKPRIAPRPDKPLSPERSYVLDNALGRYSDKVKLHPVHSNYPRIGIYAESGVIPANAALINSKLKVLPPFLTRGIDNIYLYAGPLVKKAAWEKQDPGPPDSVLGEYANGIIRFYRLNESANVDRIEYVLYHEPAHYYYNLQKDRVSALNRALAVSEDKRVMRFNESYKGPDDYYLIAALDRAKSLGLAASKNRDLYLFQKFVIASKAQDRAITPYAEENKAIQGVDWVNENFAEMTRLTYSTNPGPPPGLEDRADYRAYRALIGYEMKRG